MSIPLVALGYRVLTDHRSIVTFVVVYALAMFLISLIPMVRIRLADGGFGASLVTGGVVGYFAGLFAFLVDLLVKVEGLSRISNSLVSLPIESVAVFVGSPFVTSTWLGGLMAGTLIVVIGRYVRQADDEID